MMHRGRENELLNYYKFRAPPEVCHIFPLCSTLLMSANNEPIQTVHVNVSLCEIQEINSASLGLTWNICNVELFGKKSLLHFHENSGYC